MGQLRTFNGFEETLLSDYLQYGCWCYIGTGNDGTHRGRSTPVNAFDKVCRQLANGYECAEIDSAQEGETCVASQLNYNKVFLNFVINPSSDVISDACEAANGGVNCASRACAVELGFLRDWWVLQQQFFFGILDNEASTYKHKAFGGSFDPEESCLTMRGETSQKECCGNYPLRFPFRNLGGSRSCCGDTTYWNEIHQCCGDSNHTYVGFGC